MELNAIAINDTYNELQNTKQGEGGGKISVKGTYKPNELFTSRPM